MTSRTIILESSGMPSVYFWNSAGKRETSSTTWSENSSRKKQTSPIVNLPIWRDDSEAPNCISSPRTLIRAQAKFSLAITTENFGRGRRPTMHAYSTFLRYSSRSRRSICQWRRAGNYPVRLFDRAQYFAGRIALDTLRPKKQPTPRLSGRRLKTSSTAAGRSYRPRCVHRSTANRRA